MKIGILTFHRSLNCGAMLQAFALQRYLTRCGYKAELIEYGHIGWSGKYHFRFDSVRHTLGTVYYAFRTFFKTFLIETYRRHLYGQFLQGQMCLSKPVAKQDLKGLPYTHLVCGSDQIWHPIINEGDSAYFLAFAREGQKKIAYAPSFGVEAFTPDLESSMSKWLKDFECLSVREPVGAAIVKRLANRDADVVCDPTLLLEADDYIGVERPPIARFEDYVFVYTIGDHPWVEEYAKTVAHEQHLQVVHLLGGRLACWHVPRQHVRRISAVGPAEFLWLVRHASYMVTNSFHGAVFAHVHHIPFVVALNGNSADSRMRQLCGALQTADRLATAAPDWVLTTDMNWTAIDGARKKFARSGKQFLAQALEEDVVS